jgi:hypothetical protein
VVHREPANLHAELFEIEVALDRAHGPVVDLAPGSSSIPGTPGTTPSASPPSTNRLGYGMPIRRTSSNRIAGVAFTPGQHIHVHAH